MAETTSTFLITRMIGISCSVFLSGLAFSASYYGIPAVALAPVPLRLRQWQVIYDLGKLVSPPIAAASAVIWGVVAGISHSSPRNVKSNIVDDWVLYSTAGLLTFSVLPWTIAVMMPSNKELLGKAKIAGELEADGEKRRAFDLEAERAMRTWNIMNWVRAVLPMAGAWVGLYAALK